MSPGEARTVRQPRPPSMLDAAPPGHRADPAAGPDDRAVRDRRHRRTAPGRAAAECGLREPDRVQERLHGGRGVGGSCERGSGRHERCLHPARRGRPHRHLEHGRHHSDGRRLWNRSGQPHLVLRHRRSGVCGGGPGHGQLVDHRRHARRCLRRHEQCARPRRGHCRRRGDLRGLLRGQDDAALGDDRPGTEAGGGWTDRR